MDPRNSENTPDRARFEADMLPHMDALYRKAWRLTRRAPEAADLVQDTYLRAYRKFSTFRAGTNSKAWLFTIMYSIFVNRYRREQHRPETRSLEAAEEAFRGAVAAIDWEAADRIRDNPGFGWTEPEVEAALAALPEEFRAAVMLVDVEELTYEEAAGVLRCPVGTVRSRLSRARKQLFVALRPYAEARGLLRRTMKQDGEAVEKR